MSRTCSLLNLILYPSWIFFPPISNFHVIYPLFPPSFSCIWSFRFILYIFFFVFSGFDFMNTEVNNKHGLRVPLCVRDRVTPFREGELSFLRAQRFQKFDRWFFAVIVSSLLPSEKRKITNTCSVYTYQVGDITPFKASTTTTLVLLNRLRAAWTPSKQ